MSIKFVDIEMCWRKICVLFFERTKRLSVERENQEHGSILKRCLSSSSKCRIFANVFSSHKSQYRKIPRSLPSFSVSKRQVIGPRFTSLEEYKIITMAL